MAPAADSVADNGHARFALGNEAVEMIQDGLGHLGAELVHLRFGSQ